ncbi:T9SS type B sorting domain-containing protein, partial [Flavobacterium sp. MC2016-06]|uniref:T9SS type B sorting domain-containing protein n=1 Tax=Flavobacterium sp. MC2016-06 TaxID=2676308 RepID=UPI0031DBA476
VGALQYEILSPIVRAKQSSAVFTTLAPDTYVFQVTDANGCTYQEAYTVTPGTKITVAGQLVSNVTCNPGANGEVLFKVANFAGTYSYSINGAAAVTGQTNPTISVSGLSVASNQTIVITDEMTGCQATVTVAVAQSTPLTLVQATNVNANCNNGAQVSVTASGGVAPYEYSFVAAGSPAGTYGNSNAAILDPATATAWDVYVKDANGCVITAPLRINIAADPLPTGITANVVSQCPTAAGEYTFTVNVTSGKAPYEYSIGNGFQTSNSFTVNAAGSYDIIVKDANACTTTVTAGVTISPAVDLQATITALPSCDFNDGIIDASAVGGSSSANYRYTLDGGVVVNSPTAHFIGVAPGTHTIQVRDALTGCTDTVTVELIGATTITGFDLDATNVSCRGFSDGQIIVNIAPNAPGVNDNPIYTYTLTGTTIGGTPVSVGPQQQNVFSNLAAGDYTVLVTSGRGCKAQEDIRITQPASIVVNAPVVKEFNCTAGTNGTNYATITVNSVTGGSSNYVVYEFSKAGVVVQTGTSNVYTEANVSGGTYTVRVVDDKGCEGSSTLPIIIAPFITMDNINVAITTPNTCISNENIKVTVNTTGGVPVLLNYNLSGTGTTVYNVSNTTGIFTGLAIGNYAITVTNPSTGCSIQDFHFVFDPNTFVINVTPVKTELCYGDTDGSVDLMFVDSQLNPTDDAGAFTYTITGPVTVSGSSATAGPVHITGLIAGQYSVSAKLVNSPECTVTNVFTIVQPTAPLAVTVSKSEITCISGNNDGVISASASGGWGIAYQYELVGPVNVAYSSQSEFTGLTAGNYTINVKDEKGCIVSTTAQLVVPTPIVVVANANASMLSCFGAKDGIITVDLPTGGQGSNYTYTLNIVSETPVIVSGPQAGRVFTNLKAGSYTVTVTDGFACEATSATIVITEPTEVMPTLNVSRTQTCQTLSQLTLGATGGTAPYTYSTDAAFTTVIGSFTTSVSFDVPVGKYQYYVKDANGCVGFISNEITIDPLVPLTLDLDVTNAVVKCQGEATGVIVAEAIGGLGNYVYTLLNSTGTAILPSQNNGRFENLVVGTYSVKVVSGDCTFTSAPITIKEPSTPLTAQFKVTNVSCFGENNGKLEIIAAGGTGIVKYALSPDLNQFDDETIFDKLSPGDYQVIVQDENGCFVLYDFKITQPELLKAKEVPNSMIPEVCFGDKDGAFSVEISGGTPEYSVSLDDEKGTYTQGTVGQTIFDFTNLAGGTHNVYFKDAAGCINVLQVNMPLPVVLNPVAEVNYDCVDNASANRVTITVDESITNLADVDYQLDGAGPYQVSNIFLNVAPGDHYVTARHTNGCEVKTAVFNIKTVQPLTLVELHPGSVSLADANIIEVVASGGSPAYEYSFNGEAFTSSNKYVIYKTGVYEVIVRDQNGCTFTIQVSKTFVDICLPDHFTPNGDGQFEDWGPGCTLIYTNLTFDIFDRYGRVVAKYHYGEKWDGKYNGEALPTGDYWYVVKLNDEKDNRSFVGHFTLYR